MQVLQMMSTDLLRQQQKWKDSLMEIRQIMTNLVQQVEEPNAFHWFCWNSVMTLAFVALAPVIIPVIHTFSLCLANLLFLAYRYSEVLVRKSVGITGLRCLDLPDVKPEAKI